MTCLARSTVGSDKRREEGGQTRGASSGDRPCTPPPQRRTPRLLPVHGTHLQHGPGKPCAPSPNGKLLGSCCPPSHVSTVLHCKGTGLLAVHLFLQQDLMFLQQDLGEGRSCLITDLLMGATDAGTAEGLLAPHGRKPAVLRQGPTAGMCASLCSSL